MAAKKKSLTLELGMVKETGGTKVFGEAGDDETVKTIRALYLPKAKLTELGHSGNDPIKITIEV
jgi:hypothetical protein